MMRMLVISLFRQSEYALLSQSRMVAKGRRPHTFNFRLSQSHDIICRQEIGKTASEEILFLVAFRQMSNLGS
jgi:hypothetical protein